MASRILANEEGGRHQLDLPAELLDEALDAFAMFADDDGLMNVRHLYTAFRATGVDATDNDVIAVVDKHDPDGSGRITGDQWTAALAHRLAEDGAQRTRLHALLAARDAHPATGHVPVEHVRSVLMSFVPSALSAAEVDEMLAETDYAGLGFVDYDEFMATMVSPSRLFRNQ